MKNIAINALNHQGAGVGRLKDGMVVFVPGALPGEKVSIELVKIKKKYATARLLEIESASPERVLPSCPEAGRCGGCHLQHLNYRSQLYWKRRIVADALQRLGRLAVRVLPVLGMQNPWGYRNKVRLHYDEGRLGFYRPGSHELTPFGRCPLLPPAMLDLAGQVERLLPGTAQGLKHLTLRQGWATGELLLVLETAAGWSGGREMAQQLAGCSPHIVGIVHKPSKRKEIVLYGRDYLEERLGNLRFHISSNTFFQVNSAQAEVLYEQALTYAGLQGGEQVLDAYCGSGAIALWLSGKAGQVNGVEVAPQAVSDARRNAALNNITNASFRTGDAAQVLPDLAAEGYRPQLVILDPPRAGCDRRVLAAVTVLKPERVVYVSCNPATLARDLAFLQEHGFTAAAVQPVDMFPHTGHVEVVALMSRVED